jgi:hypothetical protein
MLKLKVELRLVLDFFDAVLVSYSICCNRHFVSTYGKMEKMQIAHQRTILEIQNQYKLLELSIYVKISEILSLDPVP